MYNRGHCGCLRCRKTHQHVGMLAVSTCHDQNVSVIKLELISKYLLRTEGGLKKSFSSCKHTCLFAFLTLFYSLTMIIVLYSTPLKTWLGCLCCLFLHSACWVCISDSSPRHRLQGPSMWNMPLCLPLSRVLCVNSQMPLVSLLFGLRSRSCFLQGCFVESTEVASVAYMLFVSMSY